MKPKTKKAKKPALLTRDQLKPGVEYEPVTKEGRAIKGTNEQVYGTALTYSVSVDKDGNMDPEYAGDTDVCWDTQKTVKSVNPATSLPEREWIDECGDIVFESDLRFIKIKE